LSFQQDCPVSAKPRPVFFALGNIAGIFEPGFCTTILLPLRRTLRLLKLNCAKHYSTRIWQRTYYVTLLFWRVGKRINEFVLNHKRAEYGKQIVVTLSRHLTWSHFLTLFPLKSEAQRLFYAQQIIQEQLSVRDLRKQIEKKA
jgi:hypothetical protein